MKLDTRYTITVMLAKFRSTSQTQLLPSKRIVAQGNEKIHFMRCPQGRDYREKISKAKHSYKVRCGILRSSDVVCGLRVQKLKSREKYMRRERERLGPFVKLTKEQAHTAAEALRTTSVGKAPGNRRKRNQDKPAPQSGPYQTVFRKFVESRQEKKPNRQNLLTIVLFATLISDSASFYRRSCSGARCLRFSEKSYFPKVLLQCSGQDGLESFSQSSIRVSTASGNQGKLEGIFPVREKSGNLAFLKKNQGQIRKF